MAVRHEQKAVEEGPSASEAAALEQERRMLYCLSQVPSLGAVSIQELGEIFDREEQAGTLVKEFRDFYEEYKKKNEGKDIPRC